METLRNLGVQIEYLILPDNRNELVSHQHILDMLQGPLFKDGGVAGITFYLLISTCNSNVFYFFQAKMPTTMFNAAGKNTSKKIQNPKFGIQSICHGEDIKVKILFFSSELFLILHISRAGFLVTMMLLQLHVRNGGIGSAPSSTITNINLT